MRPHASVSTHTHTSPRTSSGQRLARYFHGAEGGREGGVEGRSGKKKEGSDEIEGHMLRC